MLPWRAVDALVDQAPQVDPFFPSSVLEGLVGFMLPELAYVGDDLPRFILVVEVPQFRPQSPPLPRDFAGGRQKVQMVVVVVGFRGGTMNNAVSREVVFVAEVLRETGGEFLPLLVGQFLGKRHDDFPPVPRVAPLLIARHGFD